MKIPASIAKDFNLIELFRGGSIALFFKVGGILVGYLFFLFLSRIFGAEVQGIFSVCWTILMIAAVIAKMGLDTSIVRFVSELWVKNDTKEMTAVYRKGLLIVFVASTFCTALLMAFSGPLSRLYFDSGSGRSLIIWLSLSVIPFSVMSYNAESLRGLKKILQYSWFQNGTIYLLIMVFLLFIAFYSMGNEMIIGSIFVSCLILMVFSFIVVRKSMGKSNTPVTGKGLSVSYKHILAVSFPMLLTNSMFLILSWTDIQMLSMFMDEASVGIYNIAVKIAAVNVVGLAAINAIASPKFSELYNSGDLPALRRTVKQTTLINTLISIPVLIIIFVFPGFLLGLFGREFSIGKEAMFILAAGQFVAAFSGSGMHLLNMTGKEKAGRNIIVAGTILNILLNYWLIPKYGITGAALATATSTIVWRTLTVVSIYKFFGFLPYPFQISKLA